MSINLNTRNLFSVTIEQVTGAASAEASNTISSLVLSVSYARVINNKPVIINTICDSSQLYQRLEVLSQLGDIDFREVAQLQLKDTDTTEAEV